MNIGRVTTTVLVQDMDRAVRFYRDILGLAVEFEQEDWAVLAHNIGLMLSPEPLPEDALRMNAVMLTLTVDDAHAAYHELIERGVPFIVGPTDVGGAIVASFLDPDGNAIQLIQEG